MGDETGQEKKQRGVNGVERKGKGMGLKGTEGERRERKGKEQKGKGTKWIGHRVGRR